MVAMCPVEGLDKSTHTIESRERNNDFASCFRNDD